MDSVTGAGDQPNHRRLPRLCHRRLATGEREASGLVLGEYRSLEYRQERTVGLDADQEFGAPHAGDGERRLHLQTTGPTAEEVSGAPEQADHAGSLSLDGLDGDLGVGVQPQHRLVEHGQVGPAPLPDAQRIASGERVVQLDGLPRGRTDEPRFDGALYGHGLGNLLGCLRVGAPSKERREYEKSTHTSEYDEIPWRCLQMTINHGAIDLGSSSASVGPGAGRPQELRAHRTLEIRVQNGGSIIGVPSACQA